MFSSLKIQMQEKRMRNLRSCMNLKNFLIDIQLTRCKSDYLISIQFEFKLKCVFIARYAVILCVYNMILVHFLRFG